MGRPRKIKRIKFLAIKRELKNTTRLQADISKEYGVSASSVNSINMAGTWGNYLAGVKAPKPVRSKRATSPTVSQSTKARYARAKAAGLSPLTGEDRMKAYDLAVREKYIDQEETRLAAELEKLEATPTRTELELIDGAINGRITVLHKRVRNVEYAVNSHRISLVLLLIGLIAMFILALVK
ncbi:hypothetical protein E3O62_02630 [Cryobacterium sp. TMT2-15-1]|uniref:hypothetical protein n=1 Tax=Cryobacterium sp. TMT2-15-1 TaxID=1259246 RepID=UPI00106B6E44|nr:hypothetical protein [Cryobacterium sp. TMT2-15-1]TFC63741.1 hypothetical protein E3O62_02630 [Cryobacterium sp. TMT2-15-1]